MQTKLKTYLIIALSLAVVAGIGLSMKQKVGTHQEKAVYYCPMHPTYISDRPGSCPICNMKLVKKELASVASNSTAKKAEEICLLHTCPMIHDGRPCNMLVLAKKGEVVDCPFCKKEVAGPKATPKKILYWTDPMMPGYKSDKPGKSPMGMDLTPVYSDETVSSSSMAPEGYAAVMITPERQQLIGIRTAVVAKRSIVKTIRASGTVAHDPELYQAQTEYIQALQALKRSKDSSIPEVIEQSQSLVDSARIRLRHMGLSEDLIAEIGTWKEAQHSLLFAHGGPVWVYAQIYEYELPLVKVGQTVDIDVPSAGGKVYKGTIHAIDQMVDAATRTVRIRAQVEDTDGVLKPDMYVNASIRIDLGEQLAVPHEAVFDTGTRKIVFVDKGQGLFEPRDVTIGAQANDYDEVQSGIKEGETVVTSGNFLIDSESRLKSALEGMTPATSKNTPEPASGTNAGGQSHVH